MGRDETIRKLDLLANLCASEAVFNMGGLYDYQFLDGKLYYIKRGKHFPFNARINDLVSFNITILKGGKCDD
jgi:hypothetical protein